MSRSLLKLLCAISLVIAPMFTHAGHQSRDTIVSARIEPAGCLAGRLQSDHHLRPSGRVGEQMERPRRSLRRQDHQDGKHPGEHQSRSGVFGGKPGYIWQAGCVQIAGYAGDSESDLETGFRQIKGEIAIK